MVEEPFYDAFSEGGTAIVQIEDGDEVIACEIASVEINKDINTQIRDVETTITINPSSEVVTLESTDK